MAAQEEDSQLQKVQFLKDQPSARRCGVCCIPGAVDCPHGLRFGGHPVPRQKFRRQWVLKCIGAGQRRLNAACNARGRQAFRCTVNRHQRHGGYLFRRADHRVQNFPMGKVPPYPAFKIVFRSGFEFLCGIGGVEPGQREKAGIVCRGHAGEDASALDAPVRFALKYRCLDTAVCIVGCGRHRVRF